MRSALVLPAVLLASGLGGCSFSYGSRSGNASSLGDAGGRTSRLGGVSRARAVRSVAGCRTRAARRARLQSGSRSRRSAAMGTVALFVRRRATPSR
jgi:hypothetical protein